MRSFKKIDVRIDWKKLVTSSFPTTMILLNKANRDFTFAWGESSALTVEQGAYNATQLEAFLSNHKGQYIFGYLSYDIKSETTRFIQPKQGNRTFNDLHFFTAEHVLIHVNDELMYYGELTEAEAISEINQVINHQISEDTTHQPIQLAPNTNRADYLKQLKSIKAEIQYGNIYEMNYCVNFEQNYQTFNPGKTYQKLAEISNAPFGAYFNTPNLAILSASPERFIQKKEDKLTSQPIKGTAKRGANKNEDAEIADKLKHDPKELAENVMIVDLVRNDFSKIAKKNSVDVPELCGLYTFNTVHQLISTVTCKQRDNVKFTDMLEATFPMGSMTGAPKISAMKIIDQHENFARGIYSGSIGYIDPNGNYDFNVVIRTILDDKKTKSISCSVGGAITIQSNPEQEYEECLLKLKAIQNTLC